ncbi:MAG: gliding motility-associated ABC transporter substrate-binding protein GldG [Paludibacter sp.]|nr:gliding motility-associated ABC transporter substrate-binding protein GldG [Paludibacter sp.]
MKRFFYPAVIIMLIALLAMSDFVFLRIDLTSEHRYSVSDATKQLMKKAEQPLEATLFLDGELNSGFRRLRKSTLEMLAEMSVYAPRGIRIEKINPSASNNTDNERNRIYAALESEGMTPTAIYERTKDGKSAQTTVFPYLKISYGNRAINVNLLKNIKGNSGEENLNISIENLEFEITDAIRRLVNTEVRKIAFIEGHGELTEAETYDISRELSNYFQIDRGTLGDDATILNDYQVIIVARPQEKFSESDKYIIDQYIMNGGRVMWLLDEVKIDEAALSAKGVSPAIAQDLNLSDMFFKYGIRFEPVLLQDVQSVVVPVNIAPAGAQPQFEPTAWFYAPLLLTSPENPITKNIAEVRGEFVSMLGLVGERQLKAEALLATSNNTHVVATPAVINLSDMPDPKDKTYFAQGYLPVALLVEGEFQSDFVNRMRPREIKHAFPFLAKSLATRQIFVADGDIIRNETNGVASDSTTLPLGYDRYMQVRFGNREFVQNAILYLANDDSWLSLRNRTFKLRLLNKHLIANNRNVIQAINTGLPLLLLAIFGIVYQVLRKKRFRK